MEFLGGECLENNLFSWGWGEVAGPLSQVTLEGVGDSPPGAVLGCLWFLKAVLGPVWGSPPIPKFPRPKLFHRQCLGLQV